MDNTNGTQNFAVRLTLDEMRRNAEEVRNTFRNIGNSAEAEGVRIDQVFKKIGAAAAGIFTAQAAMNFARQVASVRGEFQQLEVAFKTMLGSAEKADALMSQLVRTAAITPFDLQGVANGAKQLLAYGLEADKVNETLIRLGDIAAGLSIPLGDLVYLYGTTMTQGRLYTQDLRQFMGRGIPLADELAKQFGVAKDKVGELVTAGKVGFPEVQKAIEAMTNEGGKFAGLMEAQSKTISGQISNLEDAIASMFNEIGKQSEGIISGAISGASYLVEHYEEVGRAIAELVAVYGAYKAALITLTAIEKLRYQATLAHMAGLTNMQAVMTVLTEKTKALNKAMMNNPYVIVAAAVAALGYGLYKLVTYQTAAEKAQKALNKSAAEAKSAAMSEQRELAKLKGELEGCEKGTERYEAAKAKIIEKFGQYDSSLTQETLTVQTLADKYESLSAAILKSYNARQYEKFSAAQSEALEATLTSNLDKIYSRLIKELGDEYGTKVYAQIQDAITKGVELPTDVQEVLDKIQDKGTIMADSRIDSNIRSIRAAIKLNDELDAQARKRFDIDSDSTGGRSGGSGSGGGMAIQSFSEQVEAARKKVAGLKDELAKLRRGEGAEADYAKAIEDKTKELADAQETLNTLTGYDPKAAEKARQEREREADELAKLQKELAEESAQAAIDMMEDASERKVKQIEHDYRQQRATIEAEEEKMRTLQGGTLTADQQKQFNTRYTALDKKKESDLAEVAKAEKQQAEEARQAWQEYLIEFGNYQEKRKSLIEKYDDEIAKLQKDSPEYAIKVAEKDRALEQLDEQYGKSTRAMADLFEDASDKSVTAIQSIIDKYETLVAYLSGGGDVSLDDLKEIGLTDKDIASIEKGEISIKDVTDALKGLKNELKGKSPWLSFKADLDKAVKTLKESKGESVKIREGISGIGNAVTSFAPALKEFGSNIANIFGIDDSAINSAIEGVAGLGQTAAGFGQIMSGDIVGGVMSAASGISSVVSVFEGLFGADYSRYNRMVEEYDALNDVWDRLIDKKQEYIDISYGDEARKVGEEVEKLMNRQLQSNVVLGKERLNSGASVGSHSIGVRQRKGMSDQGWKELREAARTIGFNYGKVADGRMEGLFDLSAKQLERLQEEAPTFWAKLDDDVKEYLQNIIDCGSAIEENKQKMSETFTGVSFDSFYDNFVSILSDMDKSSEDFADSFGDYLRNALLQNLLANKYKQRIQDLYDAWAAKSDSNGDGIFDLTSEEADELKKAQQALAEQIMAERDAMAESFGWKSESESESSERTASAKGIAQASQDSVNELNGRFTTIQGHTYSISENMVKLAELQQTHLPFLQNLSYLAPIEENTYYCRRLDGMDTDLRAIKQTLENIELRGITVRP